MYPTSLLRAECDTAALILEFFLNWMKNLENKVYPTGNP